MTFTSTRLKLAASVCLLPPTCFLLLFFFGETSTGEFSGFIHLFQLLPLLIVGVLAWHKPLLGGSLLTSLGLLLVSWYPFLGRHLPFLTIILVEIILFLPPFISGLLFLLSRRFPTHP